MKSGSWALPRKLACWPGVIDHLDAVGARRDRPMRTADLLRGVWFHVEHVEMTGAAPLKEENDGFGPRRWAFALRLSAQPLRQGQAEQTEAANGEQPTTRQ